MLSFFCLVDKSKIEKDFERLLQIIGGSDLTRQTCEHECHKHAKGGEELYLGCPLACAGYVIFCLLECTRAIFSFRVTSLNNFSYLWDNVFSFFSVPD